MGKECSVSLCMYQSIIFYPSYTEGQRSVRAWKSTSSQDFISRAHPVLGLMRNPLHPSIEVKKVGVRSGSGPSSTAY